MEERERPTLQATDVKKTYISKRLFSPKTTVEAVRSVSLTIRRGETVGLIGDSGSGKSTLGRCMAGLETVTAGRVVHRDQNISELTGQAWREQRKYIQYIYQDPIDSLDPRQTVEQILLEPLRNMRIGNPLERRRQAAAWLARVELPSRCLSSYPSELSRGQCQRVNIARALILEPEFIVCDEIISALDVSTEVQILSLLKDLQAERGHGYLFISHDLIRVSQMSDWVAVMNAGQLVEYLPGRDFHQSARHPVSRRLLDAIPNW